MKVLRVKNWSDFQAVKTRNAPWIMLYRKLLDDLEWHNLRGDTAKFLINLWLIGGENFGRLPDVRKLGFRLRLSEDEVKHQLEAVSHWIINDEVDILEEEEFNEKLLSLQRQQHVNKTSTRQRRYTEDTDTDTERIKGDVILDESYPQGNALKRTSLPLNWKMSAADEEFCQVTRPDLNFDKTFGSFCDYWHTLPSPKNLKKSWSFQWRQWVRYQLRDDKNFFSSVQTVQGNPDIAATKARLAAEDAIARSGPSAETLKVIAKIKGKRK
jgi:hypothetical protein